MVDEREKHNYSNKRNDKFLEQKKRGNYAADLFRTKCIYTYISKSLRKSALVRLLNRCCVTNVPSPPKPYMSVQRISYAIFAAMTFNFEKLHKAFRRMAKTSFVRGKIK